MLFIGFIVFYLVILVEFGYIGSTSGLNLFGEIWVLIPLLPLVITLIMMVINELKDEILE